MVVYVIARVGTLAVKGLRCEIISIRISSSAGYRKMSLSTDKQLDVLVKSMSSLSDDLKATQRNLDEKLAKFEQEVASAQEDAIERAIKKPGEIPQWIFARREMKSSSSSMLE